jgi:hypothetical protein
MKIRSIPALIISTPIWCAALGSEWSSIASGQTPAVQLTEASGTVAGSLALSPAIIMIRCKPGQSTTQTLTIANETSTEARFDLTIEDVVVRDGKRSMVAAGQIPSGMAATAVVAPQTVVVKPGETASVQVTLTVPPATEQRAVVTFFRAVLAAPSKGAVGLGASLGTLITFNLSGDYQVEVGPIEASLQTPSANMILSEELRNRGSEPVIPKGVIVILNAAGRRVAKAAFNEQRLLPGERVTFAATNPAQLPPGHYRTLSSFEFEHKILTSAGEFTILE